MDDPRAPGAASPGMPVLPVAGNWYGTTPHVSRPKSTLGRSSGTTLRTRTSSARSDAQTALTSYRSGRPRRARYGAGPLWTSGVTASTGLARNRRTRAGRSTSWSTSSHAGHKAEFPQEIFIIIATQARSFAAALPIRRRRSGDLEQAAQRPICASTPRRRST